MSEREMRVSHALLRPVHLGATSCCPGPPVVHPNIGRVAYPGRPHWAHSRDLQQPSPSRAVVGGLVWVCWLGPISPGHCGSMYEILLSKHVSLSALFWWVIRILPLCAFAHAYSWRVTCQNGRVEHPESASRTCGSANSACRSLQRTASLAEEEASRPVDRIRGRHAFWRPERGNQDNKKGQEGPQIDFLMKHS